MPVVAYVVRAAVPDIVAPGSAAVREAAMAA
jgi:hypothetical protein